MAIYVVFMLGLSARVRAWPEPEAISKGHWRSVGNHRYEIRVPVEIAPSKAFSVTVPWRRGDPNPHLKGTVLLDAVRLQPVSKCRRLFANAEKGQFAFTGVPGGVYHLYYMPYETCEFMGGACQYGQNDDVEGMIQYNAFSSSCADDIWWSDAKLFEVASGEYQSRTEFDRFGPMEVAAHEEEVESLMSKAGDVLLVVEDRTRPIRMRQSLPASWAARPFDALTRFKGSAQPGEAYSFQVGVVSRVDAKLTRAYANADFEAPIGAKIANIKLRCMNLQGVDYWGRNFTQVVSLVGGEVQPLWFILEVPDDASAGTYSGSVTIETSVGTKAISVELNVSGARVENHGFNDLWRGARLAWFDSKLGNENDVPPPFTHLTGWKGRSIEMLDKVVEITEYGFPGSIRIGGTEVLAAPIRFNMLVDGSAVPISGGTPVFMSDSQLVHSWKVDSKGDGVHIDVRGYIDATGFMDLNISLASAIDGEISFVVPSRAENAVYAAGFGKVGGLLRRWTDGSTPVTWKWDGVNHNNGIWVGSSKAGLRLYPKGDDPLWQAFVPFDSDVAPLAPESWSNNGQGGIRVYPNGTMEVFTGVRKNGTCTFLLSLLATPTRPLNLQKHFGERYAQLSGPANYTNLREGGATVVTMHQGNVINPWINYPYLTNELIKRAADECHRLGMKFKLYNTMRELSSHAMELDAMRAFNETFVWHEGLGGGGDWLREHLHKNYSVAWATPLSQDGFFSQQIDQSIKVKALSRWNNYYVEGLRQLIHDTGFDGIYLDEIAYDRVTLLRSKAVLGKDRLVDHHSDRGQFAKVPVVVYAEALPFIDSLWYGEGFDYDGATPDHWLVEISGVPWGLNADLLRYSGMTPFHFRGMLFGNANRWQDDLINSEASLDNPFDPRAIWALWDSFGIGNATMYGWWLSEEGTGAVPIVPNSTDVKCTVFVRPGEASLLVLANFGPAQVVTLDFDWTVLGLEAEETQLRAPALKPMQPIEAHWGIHDSITVPAPERGSKSSREGWLILLERAPSWLPTFV